MKLVMFDIDGTLTESYAYDEELFQKAVQSVLKIDNFSTDWRDYKYVTDSGILNEIVKTDKKRDMTKGEEEGVKNAFVSYIENLYNHDKSNFKEINGANSLINHLIEKDDVAVAIATGGWQESALFKLEKSGFDLKEIPFASSNDSYDRVKIMKLAEEKAKSYYKTNSFKDYYYIGDGEWDVKAAKDIGYKFIGVGEKLSKLNLDMHLMDFVSSDCMEFII
ncbi:MAG: HAD hydrolase-like protein [Desulfobacterales bacterium]|nr:HAD hydrolase-like protein [Desulfobacterales bacterium]MCP4158626.1 HAD hydrolase-like protein [Deltaproteobacteria bacterium]